MELETFKFPTSNSHPIRGQSIEAKPPTQRVRRLRTQSAVHTRERWIVRPNTNAMKLSSATGRTEIAVWESVLLEVGQFPFEVKAMAAETVRIGGRGTHG